MAPILTVIGATGAQGSSIVAHALQSGAYKVRAITRNTTGPKAKALEAQGVEVVSADVNDEASLVKAFEVNSQLLSLGPETNLNSRAQPPSTP
jgi:putative NADH-flavin reductase